jgi:hypothetical protein
MAAVDCCAMAASDINPATIKSISDTAKYQHVFRRIIVSFRISLDRGKSCTLRPIEPGLRGLH